MTADGAEDDDDEERLRDIKRRDQLAEIHQDADSFFADGRRHRAENAERREQHHVVGVPEHHLGKRFAERRPRGALSLRSWRRRRRK